MGYGLDDNVLGAYRFLVENWEEGDRIYLFGFSRGAWTARVLAGLIHLIGLVRPSQLNMCDQALATYKPAASENKKTNARQLSRGIGGGLQRNTGAEGQRGADTCACGGATNTK